MSSPIRQQSLGLFIIIFNIFQKIVYNEIDSTLDKTNSREVCL